MKERRSIPPKVKHTTEALDIDKAMAKLYSPTSSSVRSRESRRKVSNKIQSDISISTISKKYGRDMLTYKNDC